MELAKPRDEKTRQKIEAATLAPYVAIVCCVWLGWEIVKAPVLVRAPPSLSIRLAPNSADVLRLSAESEFAAGRVENARELSEASLSRAPFDARALRVRGLVESRMGGTDRADDLLTLAGNWSLRDDPAHAWLMDNRLRRGDYVSALGHADTLARRRVDLHPRLFELFAVAASADTRAVGPLLALLAKRPPWRGSFLGYIQEKPRFAPLTATVVVALQKSDSAALTDPELSAFYSAWAAQTQYANMRAVMKLLGRPRLPNGLQNRAFDMTEHQEIRPFQWTFGRAPGMNVDSVEDDVRAGNPALRVEYDGYAPEGIAGQLLLLEPGVYELSGEQRFEDGIEDPRMIWTVKCVETSPSLAEYLARPAASERWTTFRRTFTVPSSNCNAQWLRLEARPDDVRTHIVAWFDNLAILPASQEVARAAERATSQ